MSIKLRGTITAFMLMVPTLVSAADELHAPVLAGVSLCDFLNLLMTIALWVLTPLIGCVIMYAGFLMATAQGDMKKVDEGKKILWGAVIGFAVILGSKGILSIAIGTGKAIGDDSAVLQKACPLD